MIDTVKYHLGQSVYHAIAEDRRGIVEAITFRLSSGPMYTVAWDDLISRHHLDVELSPEKTYLPPKIHL